MCVRATCPGCWLSWRLHDDPDPHCNPGPRDITASRGAGHDAAPAPLDLDPTRANPSGSIVLEPAQDVAGEHEAVLLAPALAGHGKVFEEKLLEQFDIVPLDRRDALAVHLQEQLGQPGFEIIAKPLFKSLRLKT